MANALSESSPGIRRKDHQLVRDLTHRDIAVVDASDMLESAFQRLQRLPNAAGTP